MDLQRVFHMRSIFNPRGLRSPTILLATWLGITAINLNTAFHRDDTADLEIDNWILAHPFKPMSSAVNWLNSAEPIHTLNQTRSTSICLPYGGLCLALASCQCICCTPRSAWHSSCWPT